MLAAAGWDGPTLWAPWRQWRERARRRRPRSSAPEDPCLITFTSGTAGEPKAVLHGQRYLAGQRAAGRALARRRGRASSSGARPPPGWSKSARNAFIAPWLRGAAALLHDARFDPHERLELLERERVDVLCMAPTEYRVIAKRAQPRADARRCAGSSPRARRSTRACCGAWHEATGLWIRDGYGQTETGQLTGHAARRAGRGPARWAARCPGVALDGRRRRARPRRPGDRPDVLPALPRRGAATPARGGPATASAPTTDGFLYFEGRTDDVIISAGYRIGPFEVESALGRHPAVAEAAVVAAPDDERGSVVRAVVVLRDGFAPSAALARELQDHVKARTAPYKYPRIVDFAAELPRTPSGKVRRAALRGDQP